MPDNKSFIPRHDFYQTSTQVILSLYVKGYNAPGRIELVKLDFAENSVKVALPSLHDNDGGEEFIITPLAGDIIPKDCSYRVLGTKVEIKLAKKVPINWTSLLATGSSEDLKSIPNAEAGPSALPKPISDVPSVKPDDLPNASGALKGKARNKKNWDRMIDEELDEDGANGKAEDPNAGGDAALQKLFSTIYAGADDDTKRAMIKSFTESGGTTLSTDWSSISKETTPVRPPEGMYPFKP